MLWDISPYELILFFSGQSGRFFALVTTWTICCQWLKMLGSMEEVCLCYYVEAAQRGIDNIDNRYVKGNLSYQPYNMCFSGYKVNWCC